MDDGMQTSNPAYESPAMQLLRRQLAFERMVADWSAAFINLPRERVEQEIERGLQQMVELLGFAAIVLCSAATNGMQPLARGTFPATFKWFLSEMRGGQTLVMPDLPNELPAHALAEREFCSQTGLRSHVSVPLPGEGRTWGFLMLNAFHQTPPWPDELWARLERIGALLAHALARARSDARVTAQMGEISQRNERLEAENRGLRQIAQTAQMTLAEAERRYIYQVLEKCGWRVRGESGAASILQVKPTTLEARMKKLGVRRP
jgi:formate hydrogenlyase transcriptional activator